MNNSYYNPNNMGYNEVPNILNTNNELPMEQSYVENILRKKPLLTQINPPIQ